MVDKLLYNIVPVITLSTQNSAKLLQQLKSRFKRTINWNKCQSSNDTGMKPIFRLLKVACVVNINLFFFMGLYDLIILII